MKAPADAWTQLDTSQMPEGSVEISEHRRDEDWWGNLEDRTVIVIKEPFKLVVVPLAEDEIPGWNDIAGEE